MTDQNQEQSEGINTDQQYIAGVYAKSLIAAAEKAGNTDEVLEQLDSFVVDVLGGIPKLAAALRAPRITPEEKHRLIDAALSGRGDATLVKFLKVLTNHHRLDCLQAINQQSKALFNEMKGRVAAAVTVAEDLPSHLESAIQEKLKAMLGKEVILSVKKDPKIIGGMIVKVGDTVYDSSLANQLAQVRETTLEHTIQRVRESLGTFVSETDNDNN